MTVYLTNSVTSYSVTYDTTDPTFTNGARITVPGTFRTGSVIWGYVNWSAVPEVLVEGNGTFIQERIWGSFEISRSDS